MTEGSPLLEFLEVMRRLRAECAWKREQTHASLVRYLVEETHETVAAIETGTPDDLREELGDLLLQVYFHAVIAEESGRFTLDDVASGIVEKMRRRNPHVFGGADAPRTAAAVNELWESVKATEKARDSVTDGIAPSLPALLYADKVLDRLSRSETGGSTPPLLLLVPSPLLGPAVWTPVAQWLRGAGHDVAVVDLAAAPPTPAGVLEAVVAAAGDRSVVLVPHSNAGLYGARLGDLVDVRATVYVDAALPGSGPTSPLAPPTLLDHLDGLADADGVLPPWTQWWADTDGLFPDAASRAAVEAEQRRLPLAYFHERLPVPADWAARPAVYLAFGDTYAEERARAEAAGWPVRTLDGGHLHQLHDPAAVGAGVVGLLDEVLGTSAVGERLLRVVAEARADGVDPEQALRLSVRRLLDDVSAGA